VYIAVFEYQTFWHQVDPAIHDEAFDDQLVWDT
jgi:hypothetical protein